MLCKTKQEYLRELTRELRGYFKKKDVQNIISDYSEFFDAGVSEGKSEAEICEEFGDIKNLAREIADNQTDAKRKINVEKYITVGLLAVSIIFIYWLMNYYAFLITHNPYEYNFFYELPKAGVFIAPPLVLLFIKLYKKYEININEKILFIIAGAFFIFYFLFSITLFNSSNEAQRIMDDMSNSLFLISIISIFILIIIVFLALRKEVPDCIHFAPGIFILTGLYQTINIDLFILGNMDEVYTVFRRLINSFIPLIFGLSIAAIIYLYSFWRKYLPQINSKTQKKQ